MTLRFRSALRLTSTLVLVAALAGCNTLTRLSEVTDGPSVSPITNPTKRPDYRPVSMPMPAPKVAETNPNSLWRAGARAFFKDQRAKDVGDILTVQLDLSDKAVFNNKTERTRGDKEENAITKLFGLEAEFTKKLPQAVDPTSMIDFANDHQTKGDGKIDRKEEVKLAVAAVVSQVLPNGNLVITGRQEIRVNYELRELMITGVVRSEDIDTTNAIPHTKIAEMRVFYGGRGTLSDLQQPRYGTQILDIIFPF